MKIAYLILAHNNPLHLNRLISALKTEHSDIFLHVDKKSTGFISLPDESNVMLIKNTVAVHWGGFSVTQAILNLLQEASAIGKYDYFILISGADYPVKSNANIFRFLQQHQGEEFINLCKMPEMNKTFDRVEYFYFDYQRGLGISSLSKRVINELLRLPLFKRKYPEPYSHFTLYGGSTWFVLSKKCIDYILQFISNNPKFVDFYKNTLNADEMFFQTIIGNSPFKQNVVNALTYNDWQKGSAHPAAITLHHLPMLSQETLPTPYGNGKMTPLFARKFSDDSGHITTEIDNLFRKKD